MLLQASWAKLNCIHLWCLIYFNLTQHSVGTWNTFSLFLWIFSSNQRFRWWFRGNSWYYGFSEKSSWAAVSSGVAVSSAFKHFFRLTAAELKGESPNHIKPPMRFSAINTQLFEPCRKWTFVICCHSLFSVKSKQNASPISLKSFEHFQILWLQCMTCVWRYADDSDLVVNYYLNC